MTTYSVKTRKKVETTNFEPSIDVAFRTLFHHLKFGIQPASERALSACICIKIRQSEGREIKTNKSSGSACVAYERAPQNGLHTNDIWRIYDFSLSPRTYCASIRGKKKQPFLPPNIWMLAMSHRYSAISSSFWSFW